MIIRSIAEPHVGSMGLHVVRLEGLETSRQLLLIMRSRATLSAAARALVELLVRGTGDAAEISPGR